VGRRTVGHASVGARIPKKYRRKPCNRISVYPASTGGVKTFGNKSGFGEAVELPKRIGVHWFRDVQDDRPSRQIQGPNGLRLGKIVGQLHNRFEWVARYPTSVVPSEDPSRKLIINPITNENVIPLDAVTPLRAVAV